MPAHSSEDALSIKDTTARWRPTTCLRHSSLSSTSPPPQSRSSPTSPLSAVRPRLSSSSLLSPSVRPPTAHSSPGSKTSTTRSSAKRPDKPLRDRSPLSLDHLFDDSDSEDEAIPSAIAEAEAFLDSLRTPRRSWSPILDEETLRMFQTTSTKRSNWLLRDKTLSPTQVPQSSSPIEIPLPVSRLMPSPPPFYPILSPSRPGRKRRRSEFEPDDDRPLARALRRRMATNSPAPAPDQSPSHALKSSSAPLPPLPGAPSKSTPDVSAQALPEPCNTSHTSGDPTDSIDQTTGDDYFGLDDSMWMWIGGFDDVPAFWGRADMQL
ncbi:hypothetical protein LXA43DRAFT_1101896 [Ganoderma leucocontextum]|nr:hypothetical protein LXA43DRAFT_1101896 [Ganoderma leucocontextum]